MAPIQPIYLLADSQLLFARNQKQQHALHSIVDHFYTHGIRSPKAAYVGASNGDTIAYYDLFCAGMQTMGISNCKMITTSYSRDEQDFLAEANLILLAGGEVERGLKVFEVTGIKQTLLERYQEGATLIGISAGAIQLGWPISTQQNNSDNNVLETLQLVPFNLDVHNEHQDWQLITDSLLNSKIIKQAYEIPYGAGLVYHPHHVVEAIGKPVNAFVLQENQVVHSFLRPL